MKTSTALFNDINRNRWHLVKYYALEIALTSLAIFAFAKFNVATLVESGNIFGIVVSMVLAVVVGAFFASAIHNASHDNFSNVYKNRFFGEISGYWLLYGFQNFLMIHHLHHRYSDDHFDPVNPKGMNFFIFLSAPMRYMIQRTKMYLNHVHGKHADYQKIMIIQTVLFNALLALRLTAWFMLLGPVLFVSFYLFGVFTTIFLFAHINFYCHRELEDGSVEVLNLDHNLYYKVANFLTMGGYYHKNHHINLKVFNPKYLTTKKRFYPYFTVKKVSA